MLASYGQVIVVTLNYRLGILGKYSELPIYKHKSKWKCFKRALRIQKDKLLRAYLWKKPFFFSTQSKFLYTLVSITMRIIRSKEAIIPI